MPGNSSTVNPSAFLKQVVGRPVVVKLNSGVEYRGASFFCVCGCLRGLFL